MGEGEGRGEGGRKGGDGGRGEGGRGRRESAVCSVQLRVSDHRPESELQLGMRMRILVIVVFRGGGEIYRQTQTRLGRQTKEGRTGSDEGDTRCAKTAPPGSPV